MSPRIKSIINFIEVNIRNNHFRPEIISLLDKYKTKLVHHNLNHHKDHNHLLPPQALHQKNIYSNHYLNLNNVNVIGFDLDYTLVTYTVELQDLIFTLARNSLVAKNGYPKDLLTFHFDPSFAIRGLSVDTRHGVLSKLSHLQKLAISRTVRGKKPLTSEEMDLLYGNRHVSHGELSRMKPLNDLFSIAEACLIADTIELFQHRKQTSGEDYAPYAIIEDVQNAIRDVHVNGNMQNAVVSNPARYIKSSPQLGNMLTHLRKAGKQLFLCTNSGYSYTNKAMQYALGLPHNSSEWQEYFDVVICSASKPNFYNSRLPFRNYDVNTNSPTASPVNSLQPGQVYIQGSARALQEATGWQGQQILYIGDNLRTDLVEARRWFGWHTGCVINELEEEINIQQSVECKELHLLRSSLRHMIRDIQYELKRHNPNHNPNQIECRDPMSGILYNSNSNNDNNIAAIETSDDSDYNQLLLAHSRRTVDELLLQSIELELQSINSHLSKLFNPNFGSIFRTDGHPTLFAFMMLRYVDLYMSDVCHLLNYDPSHRFYPYHAMHMAHDPTSLS